MGHFDISHWTDFARGCASGADRDAMQAHLAGGCRRCRATANLMQRVVACTQSESRCEPPADVVRCAKAISALQRPHSPIAKIVARLVYDSFRQPLPAGIRADSHLSRHAMFEAGDFFLDLRLEQETESPLVTLVGQLTNRTDPNKSLTGAPVMVMTRKEVVAHAVYNRFGEFQMDYPPARHLRLCVALTPPDQRIEVSLNQLNSAEPGRKRVRGSRPRNA